MESTKHPMLGLVKKGQVSKQITIPIPALRLLLDILAQMAKGNAVTLISINAELSTQEAANMLNVSRPYLVKLLEQGKIPYRKIGTKRRVYVKDLLNFKTKIDKQRLKTLEKLAEIDQDLDLGY